jgi:hypothetical protein
MIYPVVTYSLLDQSPLVIQVTVPVTVVRLECTCGVAVLRRKNRGVIAIHTLLLPHRLELAR